MNRSEYLYSKPDLTAFLDCFFLSCRIVNKLLEERFHIFLFFLDFACMVVGGGRKEQLGMAALAAMELVRRNERWAYEHIAVGTFLAAWHNGDSEDGYHHGEQNVTQLGDGSGG